MSWKKESVMEQKERFIRMLESGDFTMSGLCKSFGISRRSGYNLLKEYKRIGEKSFQKKSNRPLRTPHRTKKEIEDKIVELRKLYKNWGARKIKKLLETYFDLLEIPSETTINAILKRNNLIVNRRKRTKSVGKLNPKFDPENCNEIWSADYKGKFKLTNGRYCYPLTVCDSKSRYILDIECHYKPNYNSVKQNYTKIFKEFGKPNFMHTDNGSPFGNTQAVSRFTKLAYWLIDHEIIPVYSDPASPQQNGRHERMHKDLKAYCRGQISTTLAKQQRVINAFKEEYNIIRPHEALQMETPQKVHQVSTREFNTKIINYDYPFLYKKLKVTKNGAARWGGYHWVFISQAAVGRYIGVQEIGDGIWNVYYRNVLLGYIDENQISKKEYYLKLNKIKV